VMRDGLILLAAGLAIGSIAAFAAARVLRSQLYEVSSSDPVTFIAVALLLAFVACLACYFPARRAAKADPMTALRCE